MDVSKPKNCFKCKKSRNPLNISLSVKNSIIVVWNKYEIFIYKNLNFNEVTKTIVPDFQILNLILCNNYLACLDTDGNVHIEALKFKNSAPKRMKTTTKLQQNILNFTCYDAEHILCLKLEKNLTLLYYQFDTEFKLLDQILILHDLGDLQTQNKRYDVILNSYSLTKNNFDNVKNIFKCVEDGVYSLIIISLDRKTVYACLFSAEQKTKETNMINLYTSPLEISNIEILNLDQLNVIIGLQSGTIVKIQITEARTPQIVHLITAIDKFLIKNDTALFTDGSSFWRSEKTFADDIKFTKHFVTQVKDFVIMNDHVICTTYNSLIYLFEIENDECFIRSNEDEYCSAKEVLNNSEYLQRIFEQIEINNKLVKKINEEENYVAVLALSNRQDVMDKVITTSIMVYENYEDAKEISPLTLTEEMSEYFKPNISLVLIKITINTILNIFNKILSNLTGDLNIHITFLSSKELIKTSSIKLEEHLKKVNYLIPLLITELQITVIVKLVTKIPGAHNEEEVVWNVLYEKEVLLKLEHFIKMGQVNCDLFLKKPVENLENLILKTVDNNYGNVFRFTHKKILHENLSFYVKLPKNYKEIFKTDLCKDVFGSKKSEFLLKQYSGDQFLNSKQDIIFLICNDKVSIRIINDTFSGPILKVSSENLMAAFDMRNFFANMLYGINQENTKGEEYIGNTIYTFIENHRKTLKQCISSSNVEEIKWLTANFEKDVIGYLTI